MINVSVKKPLRMAGGPGELSVDLSVARGDFVSLYGPSGAGKTTLLRLIAGLTEPKSGKVSINNETWFDSSNRINLPPQRRKVGFVFQDYALFPNMTVRENLTYALENHQDKSIVDELIGVIQLEDLADRKPLSLSGGQCQRVALARALVRQPDVLLLDEPFSALDADMRLQLQDEIHALHRRFNLTTIMVSHDLAEVFRLSDCVVVLDNGKVTRQGEASEVFANDNWSGKFKFAGEIVAIERADMIFVVSVIIGNNLVKVVASEDERNGFDIGDRVLVASKAFNPIIIKLDSLSPSSTLHS